MMEIATGFALPLLLLVATFTGLKKNPEYKKTKGEDFSHVWHTINGAVIHIFMDALAGTFGYNKGIFRLYSMIDARYKNSDNTVYLISAIELIWMGPVCLYLGRLYAEKRNAMREILSIMVSVT